MKTLLLRSDTHVQTLMKPGQAAERTSHFGLSDGTITLHPDQSLTIRDEQGTMKMPAPGIRRLR